MRRALALSLASLLFCSGTFLVWLPEAQAQIATAQVSNTAPLDILNEAKSAISSVANVATSVSTAALQLNTWVLQPLAFIMSGNMLKAITAGVLSFVNGKTNGTGAPQFVTNLQGNLQSTGDVQALAFIAQFGKNSNSPFSAAIASSLRSNYLQNSSLGGFFAANQCTLTSASPNINAFLAGNWNQGGVGAWMALTTQSQNNPFMLYQASQIQLFSQVANATQARLSELSWGQGFLSWCGDSSADTSSYDPQAAKLHGCGSGEVYDEIDGCINPQSFNSATQSTCTKSNGTAGVVKTPGSVIKDGLNKALGTDIDKLVGMGNIGPNINSILGSVANVMNTIAFANVLFGGSGNGAGGLSGYYGSGSAASILSQPPSYFGATTQNVYQGTPPSSSGQDVSSRVTQYETAWSTISGAATTASSSLGTLISSCPTQANAAQTALINQVAPVVSQVATASSTIAAARAMVAKVQAEVNSTDPGTAGAYTADIQTLQAMPPSTTDLTTVQQNAQTFGGASASSTTPLIVSGSTLVDQLNLLATNAQSLASSCSAPHGTQTGK